jgi:hypothetical protein
MRIRNSVAWMCVVGLLFACGCGDQSPPKASPSADAKSSILEKTNGQSAARVTRNSDGAAATSSKESPNSEVEPSGDIIVAMEDCKASRPGKITGGTSILKLLFSGPPKDKLVKRGTVPVDDQSYTLYLPKAGAYSVENTGSGDSDLENTSTVISVDHNGDGTLTEEEGWFANLPLRLGEKMFEVAEIAEDGSRIVLRASKSPLRGVIIGQVCPPFTFETTEGQEVSLDSLAGKPFFLDIWSIT